MLDYLMLKNRPLTLSDLPLRLVPSEELIFLTFSSCMITDILVRIALARRTASDGNYLSAKALIVLFDFSFLNLSVGTIELITAF